MSRIGRQPIKVPTGISAEIKGRDISVKGPKGELKLSILPGLKVVQEEDQLIVSRTRVSPDTAKAYGLIRSLVANMVIGVQDGYSRQLEIHGVGFRASVSGNSLNLNLGFSHQVVYKLPSGIEAKVEKNQITVSGADKQHVGQVAAEIRALKKPEPYKGKGIKFVGEQIRRKAGKTATKA